MGQPILYVQWDKLEEDNSWEKLHDIIADEPLLVEDYIVSNDVPRDSIFLFKWSRRFLYKLKMVYRYMGFKRHLKNQRASTENMEGCYEQNSRLQLFLAARERTEGLGGDIGMAYLMPILMRKFEVFQERNLDQNLMVES